MGKNNSYSGSGEYLKASLTIDAEVLVYELKPERINEFRQFYGKTIRPWLAENNVPETNAWIAGNYLIVVALLFMPPWIGDGGIAGLDQFLEVSEPVHMEELRSLTLSPPTTAASYPET